MTLGEMRGVAHQLGFELRRYSPGDGWTRYTVVRVTNQQGGCEIMCPYRRRAEVAAWLDGYARARRFIVTAVEGG